MNDLDPFSGPLAGITGRLHKLSEQNDFLRTLDARSDEWAEGILFELGMLIDLSQNLAQEVTKLLPPDDPRNDE